jgi:hypothetical protein
MVPESVRGQEVSSMFHGWTPFQKGILDIHFARDRKGSLLAFSDSNVYLRCTPDSIVAFSDVHVSPPSYAFEVNTYDTRGTPLLNVVVELEQSRDIWSLFDPASLNVDKHSLSFSRWYFKTGTPNPIVSKDFRIQF